MADFVCYDKILVELKAIKELLKEHEVIVINYLNGINLKLGILINFGSIRLEYKRLIHLNR